LAIDDVLDGNAGMVGTGQTKGVIAAHAMVAHQHINEGCIEGMAHVQATRDVWRRNDNAIRVALLGGVGLKRLPIFPELLPFGFGGEGVVLTGQVGRGSCGHGGALAGIWLSLPHCATGDRGRERWM